MHPELKAYVEAVCETEEQVQAARARNSGRGRLPISTIEKKPLFTLIADFLAELPPYYCELKMVAGVKRIPHCRSCHRDAIGYHGLV